jgi:hypothetical protein
VTDPRQEGTPAGTSPADVDRRSAIAEALGKEVWPADRDALVAKAQESNAPDRVLGDLRRLPAGQQFENVQDVARALGLGTEQHRF